MRKLNVLELNRLSPEEYSESNKTPVVVVLDNVRSMNNIGSIFRTADAFRLEAVFLCGITATPPDAEIHKTALGAEDVVPWRYFSNTLDAVSELKQRGFCILTLEQTDGSVPLHNYYPNENRQYALVIGHEVKGVEQDVIDRSDDCLEIPQFGTKHSLNVAVAAGIAIYTLFNGLNLITSKTKANGLTLGARRKRFSR
jgi:tRNA G18 (ribose-2'-O)-methylase SpoU